MTLDSNRTHMLMILQEVAAGSVFLNLALHDMCRVVVSAGAPDSPPQSAAKRKPRSPSQ